MYDTAEQDSVQATTPVDQASADIGEACDRLEEVVSHLRERLDKVLGPEDNRPTESDRPLTALRTTSEFTSRLGGHASRVNAGVDDLRSMLDRLEL